MVEREILSTREAALFLGLHEKTILEKAKEGKLPAARVGRRWRFSRRQLVQWIESGGDKDALRQTKLDL